MELLKDLQFITESQSTYKVPTDEEKDEWDKFRNNMTGHLNEQDGIDCPVCKNKGIVLDWRKNDYQCGCMQRRIAYQRIMTSGFDPNKSLETFKTDRDWQITAKKEAESYANNPVGWFFVGGQSGAGKTHLCTGISLKLLETRIVKYLTWRLDATRLKMLMKEEGYFNKLDEILNAPYLYIDDLFKGGITEADINLAFVILDWRAKNNLPTIISSEKTSDEIWEKDQALGGRIQEMCKYGGWYPINLVGEDKNQRRKGGGMR